MNDLMSMGIHRLLKRFTIDASGVRPGNKVLDLAGGTGDLTAKFSRLVGKEGKVVLADINSSMLEVGREKLRDKGIVGNVEYVQANGSSSGSSSDSSSSTPSSSGSTVPDSGGDVQMGSAPDEVIKY